jgi:hypothetical protein
MSDDSDGRQASRTESYRRRDVLGALGAAGALALAGCASDGGSDDDGDGGGEDPDDGDDGGDPDPTATSGNADGGRSGGDGGQRVACGSPSFAYRTETFQPSTGDATLQTSVPERASVRKTTGLTAQIYYQNYQTDALSLYATYMPAGTADDAAAGMAGAEDVTDEYDPTVAGTRVVRTASDDGRRVLRALQPADDGYFDVRVTIGERACPDATAVAATEMIDTLRPTG